MLRQFMRFKNEAPILYQVIFILLILEICSIFIAPLVVPQGWYLSSYLGEKAREATQLFLAQQAMLIPDDKTGWRNRPGVARGDWKIDVDGSRSTHPLCLEKNNKRRVLFLGSSMINGGTGVKNNETISAFLEDSNTETLNFGTMLYTLDQCLLAYRHRLNRYNPDVLIVGIDGFPILGLQNLYIPFLNRDETNMPYLKPRYELEAGSIRLIHFSPGTLATLFEMPEVFDILSQKDYYYYNFESYRHLGFLPLSNAIRTLYLKFINLSDYYKVDRQADLLTETLMREMATEARKNGALVYFLILPDQNTYARNGIRRYFPDLYGRKIKDLHSKGFHVIDAREIFQKSGKMAHEIFKTDKKHYTPLANRMIADILKRSINETLE